MSKELLAKLDDDLKLAGYKKRSRQSYVRAVRQLRNFWSCDLEEIEEQQVREYWLHCKDELDWAGATMRISYSGIKFFYQHTLKRDWETLQLLKIKRQVTPPTVLSVDEVRKVLVSLPTAMNQAFYTAIYTLGLRLGEARHLTPRQIDSQRMCVSIPDSKGDDRLVPLPESNLLPCTYFMATFTIPAELRAVARSNQAVVYRAMFECAAESLRTLEADKRFVGCNVAGFFGVLHTWGRQLQYHPHLHFVIPGGGLSQDRSQWVSARGEFLVHVRALSKMFRGKLQKAFSDAGLLEFTPQSVWSRDWVVHCKAVGDGRHTMKYLGAYVFRVAISAARIASYDGQSVRIKYQKVGSAKWRFITLDAIEFMRRFLQHVLPVGFMKVRHFGFMSPNFSLPLQRIRELICALYELLRQCPVKVKPPEKPTPLKCPSCRAVMVWKHFLPPPRLAT